MSFKEYNEDQLFLLPPSLHEFLPEGHLARVINEVVDELDLTELCERYSELGCSAYHPQMMVKVLFYGYAMGERSSRLLAHRLKSDVAYMYLPALQQPDSFFHSFSSIFSNKIRFIRFVKTTSL